MNRLKRLMFLLICLMLFSTWQLWAAEKTEQTLYAKGTQQAFTGPEKYFTGTVSVQILFPQNQDTTFSGASVTFQLGARTAWHCHPAGQHMIVTAGVCLTGTRDGKVLKFGNGETVWCPPDIDHWHGATPDQAMTHLVITGSKDGQNVIWKEKVTDAQYLGAVKREGNTMNVDQFLDKKQQAMIPIAAFTASGDLDQLKAAMAAGLDAGLTVNEIKEIPVHLYAYCGFPRALNGLASLMTLVNERKAKGMNDTLGKDAAPLPKEFDSLKIGTEVQTELSGKPVAGPLFDFAPVINEYLQAHLFGDIFARDVLDRKARELVTVSALSNMTGVEPQLKAHLGIARNVGLTKDQLAAIFTVLETKAGIVKPDAVK